MRWLIGTSYFAGMPTALLYAWASVSALMAACLWFCSSSWKSKLIAQEDRRLWPLLLLGTQLALVAIFLRAVGGGMIFSDDHPSFLYRFHLLSRGFPFIPIYNADWNAGQISRELFSSGAQLLWYLAFPFVQLLGAFNDTASATFYSLLIPYLFILLIPWSVYAAARLLEQPRGVAAVAALFAFLPTTMLSEWVLGFGTIAFSAAMGLVPLVIALAIRSVFTPDRTTTTLRLALTAVLWICLCWPLSFVCFLPLAAILLARLPQLKRQRAVWKVLWPFLLVAVLHLQSIATLLHGGKVAALLMRDTLPGSHRSIDHGAIKNDAKADEAKSEVGRGADSKAKATEWRMIQRLNPALILFALPGLFAFRDRNVGRTLGLTALWLSGVSFLGLYFKPQLELPRLIIPAAFVLCVPAALGFRRLLLAIITALIDPTRRTRQRAAAAFCAFAIFGGLFTGPTSAATAYANRSSYRFITAPPLLEHLVEAVRTHGGAGRTFISGFILHDFGATDYKSQDGGHVAPLPSLSGKPFYASHYYHVYWHTVDPIPLSFRKRRTKGIEEFLDLINATAVITFRREWVSYFRKHPRYRQVFQEGRFRLFVREPVPGGYFLEGSGEVTATARGIRVIPGAEEMVLKFRYHPLLKASGVAEAALEPSFVFDEEVGSAETAPVSFIRLKVPASAVAAKLPIDITARWPAL